MLALLLALGLSYTLHAKDVFQPPKLPAAAKWSEQAPGRESLEFQTTEGSKLRGWLYRSDRPDAPFVLFFYGSNEDLVHEASRLAWLRDTLHVNAICFDYPGYGFSRGSIGIPAIQSAVLQEFDYVKQRFAANTATHIVSYGFSIGTSMAIHVAANRRVEGLILQAPPANATEMMRWASKHDVPWYARGVVKLKSDPEVAQVYENAAAIRNVSSPLLIIQGELDDVVPIDQGRKVLDASPASQKQLVMVPAAHHNDLHFSRPPSSDAVAHFLESLQ
ncbi:MAG TPA: alpha/beta hydrolase [Candidatus Angelobacter sp.]|nr:alpha/beta hydrolase [Candidatus Angelobacter sp.]